MVLWATRNMILVPENPQAQNQIVETSKPTVRHPDFRTRFSSHEGPTPIEKHDADLGLQDLEGVS